jgi:hypothetical protein
MNEPMSEAEIWLEREFRKEERLALLCLDAKPTLSQEFLAQQEAEDWERQYRLENNLLTPTPIRGKG